MQINLNDCFPLGENGERGPLPKQALFMSEALDPKKAKYIAYVGGVGSGKSLIGCITMLAIAVQYPGDYLIGRMYMPELRITTMKTFLEICPPDLIEEYRVADAIVKIKAAGGYSTILFRQLEEPDKLRSLNLSGAYVDEASQISEQAFMLLQSRLRGKGLRKLILTTNPNGHDYIYSWFVKQDGLTTPEVKAKFKLIQAPSTENKHLPEGYVADLMATWSQERIKREIEGSFDAFEGMVYHEFRRDVHVVQPFVIPKEWTRVAGADHGYRNPSAWVFGAVDYDGNVYIYKEFYEREWLIEEICKGNKKLNKPGIIELTRGEKLDQVRMDPSVGAVRSQTGQTDWDVYVENLPRDFPLLRANNDVATGIDKVKTYLKVDPRTNKPRLFIFNSCTHLLDELASYRYKQLVGSQAGNQSEKEEPVKVNDHACFIAGTQIFTACGEKPIEQINVGDLVLTRKGFKPVTFVNPPRLAEVGKYTFTSGAALIGTSNHPIFTQNGKIVLGDLTSSDTGLMLSTWTKLYLTGLRFVGLENTLGQTAHTAVKRLSLCTEKFGNWLTGLFPQTTTFTTKTETASITPYLTLNAWPQKRTLGNTNGQVMRGAGPKVGQGTWTIFARSQKLGILAQRVGNGIDNTQLNRLQKLLISPPFPKIVNSVINSFSRLKTRLLGPSTATLIAKPEHFVPAVVYNFEVKDAHEYYANGILVSNCDALRYLIMSRPDAPKVKDEVWTRIKYNSLEGHLIRDLEQFKKPKNGGDPLAGVD